MAIEEPEYEVHTTEGDFEIRTYSNRIVAETTVADTFEEAGSKSFDKLFNYISGANQGRKEIAMTAPVSQIACSDAGRDSGVTENGNNVNCWKLGFTMPTGFNLGELPEPADPSVTLRLLEPARYAVVRYSGFWSESAYLHQKQLLETWMAGKGLVTGGEATWARYNPPFMPWFMRRNEILIPISTS